MRGHVSLAIDRERREQMYTKGHIAPPPIKSRVGPDGRGIGYAYGLYPYGIAQFVGKK